MDIIMTTEIKQVISITQAWNYRIIPKEVDESSIYFYYDLRFSDEDSLKNELQVVLGKKIQLLSKDSGWISDCLSRYYPRSEQGNKSRILHLETGNNFLDKLIHTAADIKCSDIHIEAYEERCRIRFRVDGKLVERYVIERSNYPALINKIKVKANLDIAEKRLPQDGRIIYSEGAGSFDIRVSVLPAMYGEKVVLRLLNRDATQIDLDILGFHPKQLEDYLHGIRKPHGIILVSGPTGSGKTTTLYATLKRLNNEYTNILTIEDPIEYTLEGVNQVQLKKSIGLSFASAMRTFLRQDPDIIMLGEIRDEETAQMAIRAALTGHLVLSTIHTNSAWGTVTRLVDMGIPSYLLASTLNLSVAQRLVRCLCPHCKKKEPFDASMLPPSYQGSELPKEHMVPVGCEKCYYTGYKGRKALYEVLSLDDHLANQVRTDQFDVSDYIKSEGIISLSDAAFCLLKEGESSLDEIFPILT